MVGELISRLAFRPEYELAERDGIRFVSDVGRPITYRLYIADDATVAGVAGAACPMLPDGLFLTWFRNGAQG